MTERIFRLWVAVTVLLTSCVQDYDEKDPNTHLDLSCPGCNVLFLNIELLRGDFVGLLNSARNVTPHIDKFFRNSIIFEQVSAPGGATFVSNTAVLTALEGLIVSLDTVYRNTPRERHMVNANPYRTVIEDIRDHGYYTININEGGYAGKGAFLDRGFATYLEIPNRNPHSYYVSLMLLMQTLESVPEQPSFVLYRNKNLHYKFKYWKDYQTLFRTDVPSWHGQLADNSDTYHAAYAQQLQYTDSGLGILFDLLESKQRENTIVVLYANHGTSLGEQGVFGAHGVLYQSCVHVPLLIRHPKVNRPVRIKTPISLIDLGPTILDMLGVDLRNDIAGISLVPLIKGKEYDRKFIYGKEYQTVYVRKDNWKLIRRGDSDELYDLREDPAEQTNLVSEFPGVVDELRVVLWEKELEVNRKRAKPVTSVYARKGQWKLAYKDNACELYNLHDDPGERNNLVAKRPDIVDDLRVDILNQLAQPGASGENADAPRVDIFKAFAQPGAPCKR